MTIQPGKYRRRDDPWTWVDATQDETETGDGNWILRTRNGRTSIVGAAELARDWEPVDDDERDALRREAVNLAGRRPTTPNAQP